MGEKHLLVFLFNVETINLEDGLLNLDSVAGSIFEERNGNKSESATFTVVNICCKC